LYYINRRGVFTKERNLMEKYFIIIPIISMITVALLFFIQVLFIKWTDKIFGIKEEKEKKGVEDKKEE